MADFRDRQSKKNRANIDAKIAKLRQHGLKLLRTEMLEKISGHDDLYELRNRGLGWRIGLYFDRDNATFVLLCGWKKQKDTQPDDIAQARRCLDEYLATRKGILR